MDKRKKLLQKIKAIREKQELLAEKEFELCKKYLQINDEQQWYKEEERTIGRGEKKKTYLEGRVYWHQEFIDGKTRDSIEIERSRAVKEDGEWDNIAVMALVP